MLDRAFDLFHRGVILPDVLDDEDIGRRLVAVRERLACRISAFLAVMHPSRRSVMHPPRLQQWAKPFEGSDVAFALRVAIPHIGRAGQQHRQSALDQVRAALGIIGPAYWHVPHRPVRRVQLDVEVGVNERNIASAVT